MKKKSMYVLSTLMMLLMLPVGVNATDLTSQITMSDGLGGITKFEKSYDATNDINNVVATVKLNDSLVDTILSQKPGNSNSAASMGIFYFTLNPGLDGSGRTFNKQNKWYVNGTSVVDAKKDVDVLIDESNDNVSYSSVWPFGILIKYSTDSGKTWKSITDQSNGGISIGENLANKIGVSQSELKYGVNYIFSVYEKYSWIYGWEDLSTNNREYVNISYKVDFPVSSTVGNNIIYFPSLESAIDSGFTDVDVNSNTSSDNVSSSIFSNISASGEKIKISKLDDNEKIIYSWNFDGTKISDTSIGVNTEITFTNTAPNEIKADVLKNTTNYKDVTFLNFSHDGKLPGVAEVSYKVGNVYAAGTKLYIAHFNEVTKKLEKVQEVVVDNDGYVTFNVEECSSYVLYTGIDQVDSATNVNLKNTDIVNPKTGDINLILIMISMLASIGGLVIVSKRIALKVK